MNNNVEALPPMHEKAALQDAIIDAARHIVDLWNADDKFRVGLDMPDLAAAVKAYDEWVIHWTEVRLKRNGA